MKKPFVCGVVLLLLSILTACGGTASVPPIVSSSPFSVDSSSDVPSSSSIPDLSPSLEPNRKLPDESSSSASNPASAPTSTPTPISVETPQDEEITFKNQVMYDLVRTALKKKSSEPIMISDLSHITTMIFNEETPYRYAIGSTFAVFSQSTGTSGIPEDSLNVEWPSHAVDDFSDLENFSSLEHIYIRTSTSGVFTPNLTIEKDTILQQLDGMRNAKNIKTIYLSGSLSSESKIDFPPLKNLKPEALTLTYCGLSNIDNISVLASNLRYLDLSFNSIHSLDAISELSNLEELILSGGDKKSSLINSISGLEKLHKIKRLLLNDTNVDDDINEILSQMPQLEMLSLAGCQNISQLTGISKCDNLKYLNIEIFGGFDKAYENEMYRIIQDADLHFLAGHSLDPIELDNIPILQLDGLYPRSGARFSGYRELYWDDPSFNAFDAEISKVNGDYENYPMLLNKK